MEQHIHGSHRHQRSHHSHHPPVTQIALKDGIPRQLSPPPTLLLGPGPSNPYPRVLTAMALNPVGHLHGCFTKIMDEVEQMLRYAFQTENNLAIGLTGSGAACMEATICNLLEPGESVVVGCNGYWGNRLCNVAQRLGIKCHRIETTWGQPVPFDSIKKVVEEFRPQAVFLTHGESSTGIYQPLDGIGDLCRANNCLLIVDTVVTLGGMPLFVDDWKIDAVYSGAQKCLSCPPGVSPFSLGPRALQKIKSRKTPVSSFYLDMIELGKYWDDSGNPRTYHHTASINGVYALHEALRILCEIGLENSWEKHRLNAQRLYTGLKKLNLEPLVSDMEYRLYPLTTIKIPAGVDGKAVQQYIMTKYNVEVAGGLGDLAGKVWRIGLMGYNSREENVTLVLSALEDALEHFRPKL